MNSISSISFRGGETAGSISKLTSSTKEPSNTVVTKGNGGETAGSISKLAVYQNSPSVLSFRITGGETAGSVSKKDKPVPTQCPTCGGAISFCGRDNNKEKKGMSAIGIVGTLAAVSAAAVIGLAYAHKTDVIGKMSEGKVKDFLKKLKPATEKCDKWCTTVKTKSVEYWDKFKGFFKSKKS